MGSPSLVPVARLWPARQWPACGSAFPRASVEVPGLALLAASRREGWAGPPPAPGGAQPSPSGSRHGQQPENSAGSGWMLGTAWFPAVAWLVRTREEHCEEHPGKEDTAQDSTQKEPGGRRPDRKRNAHPDVDLAGSETVVGPFLFTGGTGGGEIGVAGRAGVVGVTGVTGVGGMLESLRLSWLCSDGPPLRTFTGPSLLLDFCTHTGGNTRSVSKEAGMARPLCHHPMRSLTTLDGGLGFCWRAFLALAAAAWAWWIRSVGKSGQLSSGRRAVSLRARAPSPCTVVSERMPRRSRVGPGQNVRAPGASGAHTKLLLTAVPMQVDPELPPDVILHARVLLIMQPVQGAAHHCVHLRPGTREGKPPAQTPEETWGWGTGQKPPHRAYSQWLTCHSAKQETRRPGGRSCPEDGELRTLSRR